MTEIVVLRTHYYDSSVDRLVDELRRNCGRRIVAVVDERDGQLDLPPDILKIALDPEARGLFVVPDAAWRCGDYALFEAIRAVPDASACWLIEPDVRIHTSDMAAFFDGTETSKDADLVTAWFVRASPQWQWYRTIAPFVEVPHSVMLQLCRISRRAALHLLRERRSLSERFRAEALDPQTWPNDEAFIGAQLSQPGFRVATFKEHAPGFTTEGCFTFTKPVSLHWLDTQPKNNCIYHPVVQGAKFRKRLVAYLRDKGEVRGIEGLPSSDALLRQLQIEEKSGSFPNAKLPSPVDTAAAKKAEPGSVLPIRFWNRIRNNGDALTALLSERMLGAAPVFAKPQEPHLIGVGSILFMANRHSLVWGSGVLNKTAYLPPILGTQIRALRGKLSADHLKESGIAVGDIAFGDPGILVDRLVESNQPSRYRIGVVPHHDSVRHPFFQALRGRDDVCVINILDDTIAPIDQIAQCDIILSQSLHGLVYAESLGKPSLWIATRGDDVWTFKFKDWFTTTANPQRHPAFLDQAVEQLATQAELRDCTIDREALLQTFPLELLKPDEKGILPYSSCRAYAPAMVFFPKTHDARPGFEATRDAPALAALNTVLIPILNSLFGPWAERTYTCAVTIGSPVVPTPPQLRVMLAAMDERTGPDFAFVVRQSPALLKSEQPPIELSEGVVLYPTHKALGPTMILRSSFEKFTNNFILFGI